MNIDQINLKKKLEIKKVKYRKFIKKLNFYLSKSKFQNSYINYLKSQITGKMLYDIFKCKYIF